jgi:hypothetical protein
MEQKVALFEEYKTLTNRPWFIIDLEKTTKEALQVLVNKTKIKLGIPLSPVAPPPETAQKFNPTKKSKFNELFMKKFGHGPSNHIINGIINRHNVHGGVAKGGRTRKTRKNKN